MPAVPYTKYSKFEIYESKGNFCNFNSNFNSRLTFS